MTDRRSPLDRSRGAGRIADALLAWYDRHARRLPWRAPAGTRADPYDVWLSEIMLQQTTVATVTGYWARFRERWPTVAALAAAPLDDVLGEWAGLGYYARARNLHACAQAVAGPQGGRFPDTAAGLKALPGIGDYTAAAIAAIAFDRPEPVLDGNAERVVARLFAVETPLPAAKAELRRRLAGLVPARRPGDFAQAVMDLGATVCTPARPRCLTCPLSEACAGRAAGIAARLPVKPPKPVRPVRRAVAFWLVDAAGRVLLRQRPPRGLLGGLWEVPSSPWTEAAAPRLAAAAETAPIAARWQATPGLVRHTFTHFHLELQVATGRVGAAAPPPACRWLALPEIGTVALPTVMRKVIDHAVAKSGPTNRAAGS